MTKQTLTTGPLCVSAAEKAAEMAAFVENRLQARITAIASEISELEAESKRLTAQLRQERRRNRVYAAAEAIYAEQHGVRPTAAAVRLRCGMSPNDVVEILRDWKPADGSEALLPQSVKPRGATVDPRLFEPRPWESFFGPGMWVCPTCMACKGHLPDCTDPTWTPEIAAERKAGIYRPVERPAPPVKAASRWPAVCKYCGMYVTNHTADCKRPIEATL
jgi:hypothetical protein